jgi:hypothetical protein
VLTYRSSHSYQPYEQRQEGMNPYLKGCLITGAILFVLAFVVGGCFMYKTGTAVMNSSYMQGLTAIANYFENLKEQGWEVDDSQVRAMANAYRQPGGYQPGQAPPGGGEFVWKARQNADSDWIEYKWTISIAPEFTDGPPPNFNMSKMMDMFMLVPTNQAAMDVHTQLGLPLPPGFKLDDVNGSNGTGTN